MSLENRTLVVSGASRGIGEAIAVRAARDGANVALIAKTSEPHPKLPGTIHTAARAVEEAGGKALALVGDIRDDAFVADAMATTAETFGGIDIVVNNASAIDMSPSDAMSMKKYDLLNSINVRGTFSVSMHAIPHLKRSDFARILTISPPISLDPKWLTGGTAYLISKYGMSLATAGHAAELEQHGIAVNSLWPRTAIDTAAVRNLFAGGDDGDSVIGRTRKPSLMADAAYLVLVEASKDLTGQFFMDDEVLETYAGVTDLTPYLNSPEAGPDPLMSYWSEPRTS